MRTQFLTSSFRCPNPKFDPASRSKIVGALRGDQIAMINIGSGETVAQIGKVKYQLDPDPQHVQSALFAHARARKEDPVATPQQPGFRELAHEKLLAELESIRRGSATDTGLSDACATTFFVDHAEREIDLAAIVREGVRVVQPGGRMLLACHGQPNFADPRLNEVVSEYYRDLRPVQTAIAPAADDRGREVGYGLTRFKGDMASACQTPLAGLYAYLGAAPGAAELETEHGLSGAAYYDAVLRNRWGSPKTTREMVCRVAIFTLDVPAGSGAHDSELIFAEA